VSTAGTVQVVPAYLTWMSGGSPQEFHCFVKAEQYEFGADVTEHPVETGKNITDNVRVKTDECTIMFFETDSPIDANNWATVAPGTQVISVPSGVPQFTQPFGALQPPPVFQAWDNLITEKALAIEAGGLVGTAAGGATGGAIGALAAGIAGEFVGGVPVPVPFPPGLQPPAPPLPTTQSYQVQAQQSTNRFVVLDIDASTPDNFVYDGDAGAPNAFVFRTISLLRQLLADVQVVNLIAPYLEIDNLVINKIRIHRDASTGRAAEIEVGLKQIRFVTTTEVPAPAIVRANAGVNNGEVGAITGLQKSQEAAARQLFVTQEIARRQPFPGDEPVGPPGIGP
jgi:hypothetical protein